ncbi:SMI1/KNR4 family protein [Salinimonas marina]|uniref:SMI1/KNR4 family protein n=1 Tax=Salinimonas marina TaxID=2785918 RepID=A0A7S9DVH1_9ALTE|nr:SMI1/KNR4 family protein [Salinimonas marina]QPG04605.1 SMI1/KNR4 family protein [Salinimonas marina]
MSLNVKKLKSENPEVTASLIEEVEIVLGVKLPESYISLMKKWNGGYFDQEYQVLLSNGKA